jgi:hypothetical protein
VCVRYPAGRGWLSPAERDPGRARTVRGSTRPRVDPKQAAREDEQRGVSDGTLGEKFMGRTISCPACRAALTVPPASPGSLLRCGRCRHTFQAHGSLAPVEAAVVPVLEPAEPVLDVVPVPDPIPEVLAAEEPSVVSASPNDTRPPRQKRRPTSDMRWWRGNCVNGLNAQPGIIVLRKDLVAFVPSGESENLLGVLGSGLAGAVSPLQTISLEWLQSRTDIGLMIQDLWDERREDFDVCLGEVARQLGGFAWPRQATSVARSGGGRPGRSEALVFLRDAAELRGSTDSGPQLDRLLLGWAQSDPPLRGEVIRLVLVSLVPLLLAAVAYIWHLLSDEMPLYATFPWLGLAVLLYVALGVKVVLHWLRRKRKASSAR